MAVTANVLLVSVATINPPITNPPNKDRPIITTSRPWQTNAVAVVTNRLPTVGLSICLYVQFAFRSSEAPARSEIQVPRAPAARWDFPCKLVGLARERTALCLQGTSYAKRTREDSSVHKQLSELHSNFASYATPIGQLVLCNVEEPDSIYQKTGLSAETTSYPACPIFAFLLGFRMAPHFSTNPPRVI